MRRKLTFEGKDIKPGDTIVIRPKEIISAWEAKELHEYAEKAFPEHKVVVLPSNEYLETYDKEQYLKFLDAQRKITLERD